MSQPEDEIQQIESSGSEQQVVEPQEVPLTQQQLLEQAEQKDETFEALKEKQKQLQGKPMAHSQSHEAIDAEIEDLDENDEVVDELPEKPLIQGAIFKQIDYKESKENPVDYFVDDINEENEQYEAPQEIPLTQQQLLEMAEKQEEELQSLKQKQKNLPKKYPNQSTDAIDAEIEDVDGISESSGEVAEKPLTQGYVMQKLAEKEESNEPAREASDNRDEIIEEREEKQTTEQQEEQVNGDAEAQEEGKHEEIDNQLGDAEQQNENIADSTGQQEQEIDVQKYEEKKPLSNQIRDIQKENQKLIDNINKTIGEINDIAEQIKELMVEQE